LSLTPVVVVSVAVVSGVPTTRFKESKSEGRHLHIVDQTGSHDFVSVLSSFEVRASSTRRARVFHVGTLESRAAEMLSELGGKRFSTDDLAGTTTEGSRGDLDTLEVLVETVGETKSMDNLMHDTHHVLFVEEDIAGFLQEVSVDLDVTNQRSLGTSS